MADKENATLRGTIATPNATRRILQQYGLNLKKSLGQNFLTDQNVLGRIVDAVEIEENDGVLEIGPGIGALTQQLAGRAKKVLALEIDRRLVEVLSHLFADQPHVRVVNQDVLEADLSALVEAWLGDVSRIHVAANLPYYITTPILLKLIASGIQFEHIVVMIQKEVAERIAAAPGKKDYGSLSVAVQYHCHAQLVADVPNTVFVPMPKVGSAVLRLTRRSEPPVKVRDESFFFEVVRACFMQRRKTLLNNLSARFAGERQHLPALLQSCSIDPVRRAETLSLPEFAALANALYVHLQMGSSQEV